MRTKILLLTLLLFGYITSASPFVEFSFEEQGYSDFYINGSGTYDCTRYDFVYSQDLNAGLFPIFSLQAEFSPNLESDASIIVFFNSDESMVELKSTDFSNKVARIRIPREKITENNNLRVCGSTSFSVNSIKISPESTFGVYSAPFFPEETGFMLELETYQPIVGIPFKIDAVAKNYGSKDAEVSLSYRRDELEESLQEITILAGDTSNKGVAPKCQERNEAEECVVPGEYRISYNAVANKAVPMTLLPAQLSFTNIFGEEEKLQSDRPSIEAVQQEHRLSAQIFTDKDNPKIGEAIPLKIKIKNTSTARVNNISIMLESGLEVIGKESEMLPFLDAGQSTELTFNAKGINKGEYALGCTVAYEDKILECAQTTVLLESEELSTEILIGIGFALIALAVFAYYYFKKN